MPFNKRKITYQQKFIVHCQQRALIDTSGQIVVFSLSSCFIYWITKVRAFYDLQSLTLDTKQSCLCKDILKQKATKKQTHHTRKIVHPPRNPYVINLNLNTKCLSSVFDIKLAVHIWRSQDIYQSCISTDCQSNWPFWTFKWL